MQRNLATLADNTFDLLIIGGGIFGAGVARDAALRGLSVALVEQNDFASGTSSQSSKLIHGGFRYLEQYDFALVAESCRERRILREIAPHRVKPLPLLLPVYKNDARPLWKLRLGMTLYDLLAMYRNVAAHRTLSAGDALALEPTLRPDNLQGAILYYDCQEDDARFCIDNILHAVELGATCANYCEVIGFNQNDGTLTSAVVRDHLGKRSFEIKARAFVNAAGPWVRKTALAAGHGFKLPRLSPTKGVHLLLPQLTQSHGIFFQGSRDSRMMFALPWNDCTLIGTTDTDFRGDPGDVHPNRQDVEYLLAESNALFPGRHLTPGDVVTSFAGVRPLLGSRTNEPSSRSRSHEISRTCENMLSLAGGKYTTYRLIAQRTVDAIFQILDLKPRLCTTGKCPMPDFRPPPEGERISDSPLVHQSDVQSAVRNEMAQSVEGVMRRRVGLTLSAVGNSMKTIEAVAGIMGPLMGWSEEQCRKSIDAYLHEMQRNGAPAER
ncbi:MAG TPA: glycerol-3-phosphate dehydrogenase/oxidase [Tepidisphaeraceae bacterium]|jgi:glycerol-3-phosphate dehydrogenase|nr:glycerol-3-phosphate dehydrogenase/oxidase [Tepidisphaeraceae bacterium]